MLKDWKVLLLLFLLGLKLLQISNDFKERSLDELTFEKKRLLKARFVLEKQALIEKMYKSALSIQKENCKLVYKGKDKNSRIMTDFQSYVNKVARRLNVRVGEFNWGGIQIEGNLTKIPFSFSLTGDKRRVIDAICSIANFNKVVCLEFLYIKLYSDSASLNITGELLKVNDLCEKR